MEPALNAQGSQSHVLKISGSPKTLRHVRFPSCSLLLLLLHNFFPLREGKGTQIRLREKEREPNEELNGQ